MAAFDSAAFSTDAFSEDAFDFGTTNVGSGGTGSQTGGTGSLRRRRGRRGFLVNPWLILRDWLRRLE